MRNVALIATVLLFLGCSKTELPEHWGKSPGEFDAPLRTFFAAKEKQAREFETADKKPTLPGVWRYFEAAANGDWKKVTRLYSELSQKSNQFEGNQEPDERMFTPIWQTVNETFRAYEQIVATDPRYLVKYGQTIIESIPAGSVFAGDTDTARFVVTFLATNQITGEPFFIITRNALADSLYLEYLRRMYEPRGLNTLSQDDAQNGFNEYLNDAGARSREGKLKPNENYTETNDRIQVTGEAAVMGISAQLFETLLTKNPDRQFYIEPGSLFVDEIHSQLSPHGFIFRVHRRALESLPAEEIQRDREFWNERAAKLIGPWLTEKTSLKEVLAFVDRVYLKKNLEGFRGDPVYIKTAHPWSQVAEHLGAAHAFGKARGEIAQLYVMRLAGSSSPEETTRLTAEADLAFRQALALCPYHSKTIYYYLNFLHDQKRWDDALLLINAIKPFSKNAAYSKWLSNAVQRVEQSRMTLGVGNQAQQLR